MDGLCGSVEMRRMNMCLKIRMKKNFQKGEKMFV